jgi:PKHD-type hydroxylase
MNTQQTQTKNSSWNFNTDPVNEWAYWDKAFTPEECQAIIAIGESRMPTKATVVGENDGIRECDISWLYSVDDLEWAFRRVTDIITSLNDQFFKFDLFGLHEGFQFTKYTAPGEHYGAHVDRIVNGTVRKLSFTLQLSDPADYDGGELQLMNSKKPTIASREQGYVMVFPSYTLHEVTPVTRGTRYSLVSWVTGKPFK